MHGQNVHAQHAKHGEIKLWDAILQQKLCKQTHPLPH